jgi:hypothetical protein
MIRVSTRLLFSISVLLWAIAILRIGLIADEHMWDFEAYYYLAKSHAVGQNCFAPGKSDKFLRRSESDKWFYNYFPPSIYLFKPFTLLSLDHGKYAYLLIKCVVLVYLFWLWQCKFLRNPMDPFFLIFCLFGFNAALFLDLRSGNINLIEQAFLWSAFYFFVRRRVALFCIILVACAMVKITPILFASLLLLGKGRIHKRAFLVFLPLVICGLSLALILYQDQIKMFLSIASQLASGLTGERIFNLSSFSLIRFSIENWSNLTCISFHWALGAITYLGISASVGYFSFKSFCRLDFEKDIDREIAVYLACLTYAVTLPLFQDYQYILLLVPTYFMMLNLKAIEPYPVLFVCAILSARHSTLPGATFFFDVFWNYYPLAVALLVWTLYVVTINRRTSTLEVIVKPTS